MSFRINDNGYDRANSAVPDSIFFEQLGPQPFILTPGLLTVDEAASGYLSALKGYKDRTYATVHNYSTGAETGKLDTSGRYTHFIPCDPTTYEFLETVLRDRVYPLIKKNYRVNGVFKHSEGWQLLGYDVGYFFNTHCDNCISGSAAPDPVLRSKIWWCNAPQRKFTVIIYLNDCVDTFAKPGTYSGGEIELTRITDNGKPAKFMPKAGTLLAFPSNFLFTHRVHPVVRGYRLAAVTWIDVV